jgi:competence protein ComEA
MAGQRPGRRRRYSAGAANGVASFAWPVAAWCGCLFTKRLDLQVTKGNLMFKTLLATVLAFFAFSAFAVDLNKATQAELEAVKGIGPSIATHILDERKKGSFKDWNDMIERVKGVGEGNAAKFSAEGLTVNGAAFKGAAAAPAPAAAAKKEDKPAAKAAPAPAAAATPAATSTATAPAAKAEMKKDDKPAAAAAPAEDKKAMAKKEKEDKKAAAMKAKEDKKAAKAMAADAKASDAKPSKK